MPHTVYERFSYTLICIFYTCMTDKAIIFITFYISTDVTIVDFADACVYRLSVLPLGSECGYVRTRYTQYISYAHVLKLDNGIVVCPLFVVTGGTPIKYTPKHLSKRLKLTCLMDILNGLKWIRV